MAGFTSAIIKPASVTQDKLSTIPQVFTLSTMNSLTCSDVGIDFVIFYL